MRLSKSSPPDQRQSVSYSSSAHKQTTARIHTQVSVTVGGQHLENSVVNGQDGDIESTTSQIEDEDVLLFLLVETVGDGGGGGLVDDTLNLQTSDDTGVTGGLTLSVVEVGRDGNNYGNGGSMVSIRART